MYTQIQISEYEVFRNVFLNGGGGGVSVTHPLLQGISFIPPFGLHPGPGWYSSSLCHPLSASLECHFKLSVVNSYSAC